VDLANRGAAGSQDTLKEALAPLGVPIHLYAWGPRRLGIISRGILFRIQRVVNYQVGLQFKKTEAVLFTNEPGDIGLVRGDADQLFTLAEHTRFGALGAPSD
jgi:hypothetical protein